MASADSTDDGALRIPLTRGLFTIIDPADLQIISSRSWQACIRRDGKTWYAVSDGVRMHRLLLGAKEDDIVDHRDGNGWNNRRTNLRTGTFSLNCVNRQTTPGDYLRGVSRKGCLYQARIKVAGKMKSLGCFQTELEAHEAYLHKAREMYGDWVP